MAFMNILSSIGMVDLSDYAPTAQRDPWEGQKKFQEPNTPFEAKSPEGWPAGEKKFQNPLEVVEKRYPRLEPTDPIVCCAPYMKPLSVQNEPVLQDAEVQSFLESLVQEFDDFLGRYGTMPNCLLIHQDYEMTVRKRLASLDEEAWLLDSIVKVRQVLACLTVIYTEKHAWQLAFLDPLS